MVLDKSLQPNVHRENAVSLAVHPFSPEISAKRWAYYFSIQVVVLPRLAQLTTRRLVPLKGNDSNIFAENDGRVLVMTWEGLRVQGKNIPSLWECLGSVSRTLAGLDLRDAKASNVDKPAPGECSLGKLCSAFLQTARASEGTKSKCTTTTTTCVSPSPCCRDRDPWSQ
eukprot:CAMPEP_0116829986 /NCGR_PEP_ID=MMETSP0418-20121206/4515_1 /TAXON_ID=1158023 /ORGANISM="Astrosyne radiata, Strain 13vi08-1A" /LENGTH=168 /DNA_ID=CAMNT_0004459045 /DNA_START=106 /DNA_END=612 /DNA_ORIENTATION=-